MKISLKIYAVLFLLLTSIFTVQAKNDVERGTGAVAKCGDIINSEFTSNYEEDTFTLSITAGDTLDISLVPLGGQLKSVIFLTGPTNLGVSGSNVLLGDPSYLGTGK